MAFPGVWQPYTRAQNPKNRYHLVQSTIDDFWEKWIQLYAPTSVIQQNWNVNTRNLRLGDVVIVKAAERGGQLTPGPKQVGAPKLRNILKLNKAPSKSGLVQGINGCI